MNFRERGKASVLHFFNENGVGYRTHILLFNENVFPETRSLALDRVSTIDTLPFPVPAVFVREARLT